MRVAWAWAWVMLWWCLTATLKASEIMETVLWRNVLVESPWIWKAIILEKLNSSSLTLCGSMCMKYDWCQLWCHIQPQECVLTSHIVSGSYQPLVSDSDLLCYTNRRPDLAVGAAITTSERYNEDKRCENLIDGRYSGDIWDVAVAGVSNDTAWFLVDLKASLPVSEVLLMAQSQNHVHKLFKNIEVKVGDVPETGNFTSYKLLGTFIGPGIFNQVVVLRPSDPLKGRYVSIQKLFGGKLQIAHLEIR